MLKLQPQSIARESDSQYRVKFKMTEGKSKEYTFSMDWLQKAGDDKSETKVGVLNCDQNEFFILTHDDPGALLLLQSIDQFDQATRTLTSSKSPSLISVTADAYSRNTVDSTWITQPEEDISTYSIHFQTENGGIDCALCIPKANNSMPESSGFADKTELIKITNNPKTADLLLKSIFALHEARASNGASNALKRGPLDPEV